LKIKEYYFNKNLNNKIMETNQVTTTEKKYLDALIKLHNILEYTDKISISKFMDSNELNKNFGVVLKNGGLISSNNLKGRGVRYEWKTIKPNIKMAQEVVKRVSAVSYEGVKKSRGGAREGAGRKPKSVENRYLYSFTIPLFWGLTKINVKANYKIAK